MGRGSRSKVWKRVSCRHKVMCMERVWQHDCLFIVCVCMCVRMLIYISYSMRLYGRHAPTLGRKAPEAPNTIGDKAIDPRRPLDCPSLVTESAARPQRVA